MSLSSPQGAVLEYLASPAWTGGIPVKRIDTHAASVFLAGMRVLKVKRAVKFSYLDYSTLELRKRACLSEIEVNRPFAPELYLGLTRITRSADGSFEVGGDGEVVEWAVEMQRFDEALTLDHYVTQNEVPAEMANAIVKRLAEVHRTAPRQDAQAWIEALARFLREHNRTFLSQPFLFDGARAESLLRKSEAMLSDVTPLIRQRGEAGLLVRGHGDLHLGNIALIRCTPVIFDAVEFDPLIASGDVLYDLSFLLMDLFVHSQNAAANAALNGYLAFSNRSENLSGLRLLPLFLSIRASIRAVVASARYERSGENEDAETARHYFDAACRFIVPASPQLIAIGGLSGTGKSFLARLVAPFVVPEPGAVVLRSDVKRKNLFGVAENVRLGRSAYTQEIGAKVYASLLEDAKTVLDAGHSAIVDAVFAKEEERAAVAKTGSELSVQFHGIFLHAGLETRLHRVKHRKGDASDADAEIVREQESYAAGAPEWEQVDSSGDAAATLRAALKTMGIPES